MDRHAQKQVLLARIAYERIELRRDVAQVREAARLPQLLRAAVGAGLGQSLFGASWPAWLSPVLALLRRYRVAATLFGAVAPLLRGRAAQWRRIVRLSVLGLAAWFGWRAVRSRRRGR